MIYINDMKGGAKMVETIVAMFNQFVENVMAPGFDFYDIIATIITILGLGIIL